MQLGLPPEDAPEERLWTTKELAKLWGVSDSYVAEEARAGRLGFIDMARRGTRVYRRYTEAHIKAYVDARELEARESAQPRRSA